jgi:hypothetical protein
MGEIGFGNMGGAIEFGSLIPLNYTGKDAKPATYLNIEYLTTFELKHNMNLYLAFPLLKMDFLNTFLSGSYYDDIWEKDINVVPGYYKIRPWMFELKVGIEFTTNKKSTE